MPAATSRRQPNLLQLETFSSKESFVECGNARSCEPSEKTEPRRVRFRQTVNVRPTIHVDDISEQEKMDTWFSQLEFNQIKDDVTRIVKMMIIGTFEGDNDEDCSRGLECRTRTGAIQRRENKWVALHAVLDEQDRQIEELDFFDDDLLRKVYIQENKLCRQESLEMGIRDFEELRLMYDIDEEDEDESEDEIDYCNDIYENMRRNAMNGLTERIASMSRDE